MIYLFCYLVIMVFVGILLIDTGMEPKELASVAILWPLFVAVTFYRWVKK